MTDFDKFLAMLRKNENLLELDVQIKRSYDSILEKYFDEISLHGNSIIFSFSIDGGMLSHVYP